jgi:toxin ParE1/3/4
VKLIFTGEAEADLKDIIGYVAEHNAVAALRLNTQLQTSCNELTVTPRADPLVQRYHGDGIRRRVVGSYLIFYRVSPDAVEILHILHHARDYEHLLFPDA